MDPKCPLCGRTDNIRGYKVLDGYGWWSLCYNDHGDIRLTDRPKEMPGMNEPQIKSPSPFCGNYVETTKGVLQMTPERD